MLLSSSVCLYVKVYAMIFCIPSWSRQFLILLYEKVSMKPFHAFNFFCKLLWREKEEERRKAEARESAAGNDAANQREDEEEYPDTLNPFAEEE